MTHKLRSQLLGTPSHNQGESRVIDDVLKWDDSTEIWVNGITEKNLRTNFHV